MRRAELRRQFGSKLSRAASIKTNLDKYLALNEKSVEELEHYSTRVSLKHKADLQEKQKKLVFEKKRTSGIVGPEEEVAGDGEVSELFQRTNNFTRFLGKWGRGGTRQKIEPPQNTSATETQTDQPKSTYVLSDVSTEEELKQKEEARAEKKRQVQLKLEYQMQNLKIEQERRARETDEQLRQLEEPKTLEMLKLEINIDEQDELHPQRSEKPIELDSGDFLGNISCSDDEDYLAKTENLFNHRVTINKMQTMLQPHLSGNTVTAGWGQ